MPILGRKRPVWNCLRSNTGKSLHLLDHCLKISKKSQETNERQRKGTFEGSSDKELWLENKSLQCCVGGTNLFVIIISNPVLILSSEAGEIICLAEGQLVPHPRPLLPSHPLHLYNWQLKSQVRVDTSSLAASCTPW